ncbi:hypothetical protein ACMC9I_04245 [Deinococcota bacterium DY0809b]
MNHIGPYLLNRIRAREGAIEIWEGQDTVTGTPVLVYRPLEGAAPSFRIQGTLNWQGREDDAWIAELPFGAVPLAQLQGEVSPHELTAWTRRLLGSLLEMKALGLEHGRLDTERLWVKGDEVWIEGVGLPVPVRAADETALVEALREAAGDTWPGWPFHRVMERLAEGAVDLREAAEYLADPRSLSELEALAEDAEEESEAPLEPPETGTVRVLGRPETPPASVEEAEPPEPSAPAPPSEPPAPEPAPQEAPLFPPEPERAPAPPATGGAVEEGEAGVRVEPRPTDPSRVVRIDEVSEPAFEVIEPRGTEAAGDRRWLWRAGVLVLVVLLAVAVVWWKGRAPASGATEGYAVEFRVEPPDGRAELVLLDAPEASQLVRGRVLAIIPGKVYFDAPGVYRIQIRAEGYLPQEKLLNVPPSARTVTVRLGP